MFRGGDENKYLGERGGGVFQSKATRTETCTDTRYYTQQIRVERTQTKRWNVTFQQGV